MAAQKLYFSDKEEEEDTLTLENCHPNFVDLLRSVFYYDCTDEFSPFGNDDGSDQLYNLEDWYRDNKGEKSIVKWLYKTINSFGFKITCEAASKIVDETILDQFEDVDPDFLRCMDNTIIATAFGQFKISGQLDVELKELALLALKRQKILQEMEEESEPVYLERLAVMENDLLKMDNLDPIH
jgi:uncharacterized protein YfeS